MPLSGVTSVPVGTVLDTKRGVASLSSRATGGKIQTARFKFGRFRIGQSARRGATTELKLTGPLSCGRAGRAAGQPLATAAGKRGRGLWGSGKGNSGAVGKGAGPSAALLGW